MKAADFVINYIADQGIKDVFVVYGAANGDLIDGFVRTDKTRYVCPMHEQAGGFAMEGYAKVSGKTAVGIATSGPGGQNFVTPAANCYFDSVPAVFITGQVKTKYQKKPDSIIRQIGFQEADMVGIFNSITKYATMVRNPKDIKYELQKAFHIAQEGRPGSVLLDLPIDIQKADINPEELKSFKPEAKQSDSKEMDRVISSYIKDLSNSERPVMFIGGGVRLAGGIEKLLEIGEKYGIPMFPTWNATDVVTSDLSFYGGRVGTYGGRGRNFGVQNSDLFLSIGSRISGRIFGSQVNYFARGAKKYLIDIDLGNTTKGLHPLSLEETLTADAKTFLEKLDEALEATKVKDFSDWMRKVTEWRDRYDPVKKEFFEQKSPTHPYAFTRILSEEMQRGDILVGDCGGNIVTINHAFETKRGQRSITNNGNSPMGFSFAGAMGAYLASDKKHNTVCIIGDGGFNMNIQELQTVRNYNLAFKTFIMNNHVYGITKAFQERNFEGRMEACGPVGYNPPDFIPICEAYGIKTFKIKNNKEARNVIRKVLEYDGPAVCDVDCHEHHTYLPSVSGDVPIEDMKPFLPREEFRRNMIIPPVKGWENNT